MDPNSPNNELQQPAPAQPAQQNAQQPAPSTPTPAPQEQKEEAKPKPMQITMTLPTNAYFVSGIRDFTLNLIRNMTQLSEQWAFRFQSVVDELCNNAIEHGSAPGDMITITFINNPNESIEIIVRDSGRGVVKTDAKNLNEIVKERTAPDYVHTGIRGRGLSKIVSKWTDELIFSDVEGGGIQARVKKFLQDPNTPQPEQKRLENPTHLVLNN